ncbi:MAG: hypothetical protein U0670_05090 [Anaerolineae bacterium]
MTIHLTRSAKGSLTINTPVMPAAGIFGFGDEYRELIQSEKLGAIVTNPVTYAPWSPASGTRVVPLAGGVLVHTGLPNPGLNKVINAHRNLWTRLPVPLILHLVVGSNDEIRRSGERIEEEECIAAVELGLADDIEAAEAARQVQVFTEISEKPLIARVPFGINADFANALVDAGAGAVVVCAPPRGTARDSTGRLISGRVYSPVVKPMVLRLRGNARRVHAPVIAGIRQPAGCA